MDRKKLISVQADLVIPWSSENQAVKKVTMHKKTANIPREANTT